MIQKAICQIALMAAQGRGQGRSAGFQPVSNLLYRRASSLRAVRTISRAQGFGRSADWKSATQQVGNLRYAEVAGLCQWPCDHPRSRERPICGTACALQELVRDAWTT